MKAHVRLVLVEDHPDFREVATQLLRDGFPDADVQSFGDAEAALAYCNIEPVNVVITDIALPGISGMALLQLLHRQFPYLPVIIQTLYDLEENQQLATILRAFRLLNKSALAHELVPTVKAALAASQGKM
jgi:DNA-binding NtrC family response regulator